MQLALNYSPQAVDALRADAIAIDVFKCPPWDDLSAQARVWKPIYIHFPLRVTQLGSVNWDDIERWLGKTDTHLINIHLGLYEKDMPTLMDEPEAVARERVIAQFVTDLELLASRFGAERVVAENVPFGRRTLEKTMLRPCIEPEIITQALTTTGCGLLLDIAHATITAHSLGVAPLDYMRALPLARTKEVHIAGVRDLGEGLRDHLALTEADMVTMTETFALLLQHGADLHMVASEYGGITSSFDWRSEYGVIITDTPKIAAVVNDFRARKNGGRASTDS